MKVILADSDKEKDLHKIYTACRTCYNVGSPVDMYEDETIEEDKKIKLIKQVISSGHLSTIEHVSVTFFIEGVSRSLTHQLVRHRIASYCVAGDTIIKQRSHGESRTIKELYESSRQYNKMRLIRCVNEKTRELLYNPVGEIVYSGVKPVYEVTTEFGYKIKTTLLHKFYTTDGWKELADISVGDCVYVNGTEAYKDKEWLHRQYNILNKSQEEIGEECGVSKHTIRKWVRTFNLQKPMGSWTIGVEPVNKGRTKYDYEPMQRTSNKMMGNKNGFYATGADHHSWKSEGLTVSGGYNRTNKLFEHTGVCLNCGYTGYTELHHMDKDTTNTSPENIKELCVKCHHAIHKREIKEVIIPNKVISIEYVGEVDTYDISMAGKNHNFIANGFVVHNSQQSQRYCEFVGGNFNTVVPSSILETRGAVEAFDECMEKISSTYANLIDMGVPAEDARAVLPNACTTNISVTMNLRSFMHFCEERCCSCAQKEIKSLANMMASLVKARFPFLKDFIGPKCQSLGYCNEPKRRSCGRAPLKNEIMTAYNSLKKDTLSKEDYDIIMNSIKNPKVNEKLQKLLEMESVVEE